MTTPGGPQDAVPQDAVPDERPERPPAPPTGPALWRLLAVHVALLLLLVLGATALGDDHCPSGAFCLSPGDLAGIALVAGGVLAALSLVGGTVTVLVLARRVRRTGARVLLGVAGGAVTVVAVGAPLTRPYLGL